jgi:hypothetical protein
MDLANNVMASSAMMFLVLKEEVFISAVRGKCDGGYSETREATLEAIPRTEGAGRSPDFAKTIAIFLSSSVTSNSFPSIWKT